MSKEKTGWTDNESTAGWGTEKAPPPPPEPGLYRFEVAKAETKKVGQENKPGISMVLLLKEPAAGGDSVEYRVFATHACTKERWYMYLQLAAACDVDKPDSNGTVALQEFCQRLEESRGGIVRIKHGKGLDGQVRADVAFGSSYLTDSEAQAELAGGSADDAAPVARRKGKRGNAIAEA